MKNEKNLFQVGNKIAEKWNPENVCEQLETIKAGALSGQYVWLGDGLINNGLYKEIWTFWKDKFSDNDKVMELIKLIEAIFENNQYKGALGGKLVPSVAIFGLKNNHGWSDKQDIEISNKPERPLIQFD
jgi:hypothetical protein